MGYSLRLFLVLSSSSVLAQSSRDSLLTIWQDNSRPDTVRLDVMNEYLYLYAFRSPPDTTIVLANEMYALAIRIGSKRYQADAMIQHSRAYLFKGDLEKALNPATQSLELRMILFTIP